MSDTILLTKTMQNGKTVQVIARDWGKRVEVLVDGEVRWSAFAPLPIHFRHKGVPADATAVIDRAYLFGAYGEQVLAAWAAVARQREARLNEIIPGLDLLRHAVRDRSRYDDEFEAMMEDEGNDGARPPKPARGDVATLAGQYPRAALYLKAEAYADASNDRKVTAGKRAMEILESGGDAAEAEAVLKNWLPEESMWD